MVYPFRGRLLFDGDHELSRDGIRSHLLVTNWNSGSMTTAHKASPATPCCGQWVAPAQSVRPRLEFTRAAGFDGPRVQSGTASGRTSRASPDDRASSCFAPAASVSARIWPLAEVDRLQRRQHRSAAWSRSGRGSAGRAPASAGRSSPGRPGPSGAAGGGLACRRRHRGVEAGRRPCRSVCQTASTNCSAVSRLARGPAYT